MARLVETPAAAAACLPRGPRVAASLSRMNAVVHRREAPNMKRPRKRALTMRVFDFGLELSRLELSSLLGTRYEDDVAVSVSRCWEVEVDDERRGRNA